MTLSYTCLAFLLFAVQLTHFACQEAYIKSSSSIPYCNSTGACTTIIDIDVQFSLGDNYVNVSDSATNSSASIQLDNMRLIMTADAGDGQYMVFDHTFRDAMPGCSCCFTKGSCSDPNPQICGVDSTAIDMTKLYPNTLTPYYKLVSPGGSTNNKCLSIKLGSDVFDLVSTPLSWISAKTGISAFQSLADDVNGIGDDFNIVPDAHCCYLLMADTVELFNVYSTTTYMPSALNVTYNGAEYTLTQDSIIVAGNVNLTYLSSPMASTLDNRYSLLVAPNASVYLVESALLNNPDGGDPTKYGWWNQRNQTIQDLLTSYQQYPDPLSIVTSGGAWTRNLQVLQLNNWFASNNGVPKISVSVKFNPNKETSFRAVNKAIIAVNPINGGPSTVTYSANTPFTVFSPDVSSFYQRASKLPSFTVCMAGLVICACNKYIPGVNYGSGVFNVDQDCTTSIIRVQATISGSVAESGIIYSSKRLLYTSIFEAIDGFVYSVVPTAPVEIGIRSDTLFPYIEETVSCTLSGGGFTVTTAYKILTVIASQDNCKCIFTGDVTGNSTTQVMFNRPTNVTMSANENNIYASCGEQNQIFSVDVAATLDGLANEPITVSTDLSLSANSSGSGSSGGSLFGLSYLFSTFFSAIGKFFSSAWSFVTGFFGNLKSIIYTTLILVASVYLLSFYVHHSGSKSALRFCCCCVRRKKTLVKQYSRLEAQDPSERELLPMNNGKYFPPSSINTSNLLPLSSNKSPMQLSNNSSLQKVEMFTPQTSQSPLNPTMYSTPPTNAMLDSSPVLKSKTSPTGTPVIEAPTTNKLSSPVVSEPLQGKFYNRDSPPPRR